MDELDTIVAEEQKYKEEKQNEWPRLECAAVKAKIERSNHNPEMAEEADRQVVKLTPEGMQVISKVRLAGFGSDQTISHDIAQIHTIIGGLELIRSALREFAQLDASKFVLADGSYDKNAPMKWFAYFTSRFAHADGIVTAMKRSIASLRWRAHQLHEARTLENQLSPKKSPQTFQTGAVAQVKDKDG